MELQTQQLIATSATTVLQTLISWPVAVVAVSLIFKTQVGQFLDEIVSIRFGNNAVERQQQKNAVALKLASVAPELAESEAGAGSRSDLDEKERYEFLFLNQLLVPNTKSVMLTIANWGSVSESWFLENASVAPEVLDSTAERRAILSVLNTNKLVQKNANDHYELTPKAKKFLKAIGMANSLLQ